MGKITGYDRLMATKRHPEFIKDYRKFKRKFKRHKLPLSLGGWRAVLEIEKKWGVSPSNIEDIERLEDNVNLVQTAICIDYDRLAAVVFTNDKIEPHVIPDEPLLYLEIDLKNTKGEIMRGVKQWINLYKTFMPKEDKRARVSGPKHRDFIWKIYDLHKKGRTLLQIARDLSGEKGNPSHNSALKAYYDTVKRAFHKASTIIQSISPRNR